MASRSGTVTSTIRDSGSVRASDSWVWLSARLSRLISSRSFRSTSRLVATPLPSHGGQTRVQPAGVAVGALPHEELATSYPLAGMLEDMRKYVRAGIEVLSSQGTDERAGAFLSRAQAFAEQLSSLAAG